MIDGTQTESIGSVDFILIHHKNCPHGAFHFLIDAQGVLTVLRDETVRGQHKRALGIVLANDYDTNSIEPKVWTALIDLLFNLKLKYAHALIGLHRQVRAKRKTSCPGINFPSQRLKHWIEHDFPRQRDAHIAQEIESQYGP